MKEKWRDIEKYEKSYQVSNFGRVKSKKRSKHIIMKPKLNRDGYLYVNLTKDKKQKTIAIHKLVTNAFLGEMPDGLCRDHIDRDKQNNNLSNLRYVTYSQNNRNKDISGQSTEYVGVTYHKNKRKWQSQITHKGKYIYLGLFKTAKEAARKFDNYIRDNKLNIIPNKV
jgi:hypothetical protein